MVEDNDALREQLMAFLSRPGWQVRGADGGEQLDELLRDRPAQVLVLDLNLPLEDGTSIAQRMRTAYPDLGIVMLTARVRSGDRTAGYASGADVPDQTHQCGRTGNCDSCLARRLVPVADASLVLDLTQLALRGPEGVRLALTAVEARLLQLLATAPQRQLDTDYLLHMLYPAQEASLHRNHLAVLISRLRTKLNASDLPEQDLVRAVRGQGYRLAAALVLR